MTIEVISITSTKSILFIKVIFLILKDVFDFNDWNFLETIEDGKK